MFRRVCLNHLSRIAAFLLAISVVDEASAQPAQWMPAGNLPSYHRLGAIAPLPSGRWIVAGGYTTESGPAQWQEASVIRTSTGGWIRGPALPENQGHRQQRHIAVLDDGSLLYAGEPQHIGAHPHDRTAHRLTGTSTAWEEAGVTVRERYAGRLIRLGDGDVLFIGGYNGHSGGFALASTERYDPSQNQWTFTASMATARGGLDAVVLTDGPNAGDVLVCGGFERSGIGDYLDSCELYDPVNEVFSTGPTMNTPRTGGVTIGLPDGRVVVIGGRAAPGQATGSTEIYDPTTNQWTETASMSTSRGEVVAALLPDGDIIVSGGWGNDPSEVFDTVERFDPLTGTWSPLPDLPEPRARHVMAVLNNGDVLIAGGVDDNGDVLGSALILPSQTPSVDGGVVDSGVDAGSAAPDGGSASPDAATMADSGPAPDSGSTDPADDDDSGCSCRQDSTGASLAWWPLLGLVFFFIRRRPRRAR